MNLKLNLKEKPALYVGVVSILIILMFLVGSNLINTFVKNEEANAAPIQLKDGWQYRWEKPGTEYKNGMPNWDFNNMNDSNWKEYAISKPLENLNSDTALWARIRLPEHISTLNQSILFYQINFEKLKVYIDDKQIFDREKQLNDYSEMYAITRSRFIIPVMEENEGKVLSVKVESGFKQLGLSGKIFIGENEQIMKRFIKVEFDNIVLGFFFLVFGIVLLPNVIFLEQKDRKTLVYLCFFIISLGVWNLSSQININFILFDNQQFWVMVATMAAFFAIIFFMCFFEQIFNLGSSEKLSKFWKINIYLLIFLLTVSIAKFYISIPFINMFNSLWLIVFAFDFILQIFLVIKYAIKGNTDARIFTLSFITYAIICAYELALYALINKIPFLYKWGMLIFVASIILILGRRFSEAHRKHMEYSKELEIKNEILNKAWDDLKISKDEVELLNKTLEKRVIERTQELKGAMDNLVQTQEQLIQAEKMAALGSLVAGVAHEINTPVGVSVTAASHLEKETVLIDDLYTSNKMKKVDFEQFLSMGKELTDVILNNLRKAAELVSCLKQVAVDQSSEDKRKFKVREYINEILVSLSPKLKKTKHHINIYCSNDLEIESYAGAFSQIITNLVMNSLIHAYDENEEGYIDINIVEEQNSIKLIYKDDGKGIEKQIIDKIYEPFFTTKRNKGGTGLGLNILYNIITQKLNGTIRCISEIGVGTIFMIEFPTK